MMDCSGRVLVSTIKSFSDSTDEDDSNEDILKQALPVEEIECEFIDESKRFLDPNNYLLYVRKEAAKYPDTLTASIKLGDKEDVVRSEVHDDVSDEDRESGCLEKGRSVIYRDFGPKPYLNDFSTRWKQCQADYFLESQKEFRFAIDVFLPSITQKSMSAELITALRLGRCIDWLLKNSAKLSHFIGLPQVRLISLDSAFVSKDKVADLLEEFLPECSPNKWMSDLQPWLYSALLALEKPLHPNTCSLLRKIAEQFCKHLQVKNYPDGNESPEKRFCYVVISIIGIAFGQRDIIDNL